MYRDINVNSSREWKLVVGLTKYEDRLEDNLLFMTEDEEKEFCVGNSPVLKLNSIACINALYKANER